MAHLPTHNLSHRPGAVALGEKATLKQDPEGPLAGPRGASGSIKRGFFEDQGGPLTQCTLSCCTRVKVVFEMALSMCMELLCKFEKHNTREVARPCITVHRWVAFDCSHTHFTLSRMLCQTGKTPRIFNNSISKTERGFYFIFIITLEPRVE